MLNITISIATFSLLFASYFFFHKIFIKINEKKIISGVGFLLLPYLIFLKIFLFIDIPYEFLLIILIPSSLYLIDDIITIDFKIRIFLQLLSGILIYHYNFNLENLFINFHLFTIIIIFTIILINALNFNDGSNGNIGILLLQLFVWYIYICPDKNLIDLNFFIIIFLFLFLITNIFNISYFGDSGCFVFASIFLFSLMSLSFDQIFLIIIPLVFNIIDVFFVIIIRLIKKENLLSRNYYHLYQILDKKYGFISAVIPSLLNNLFLLFIYNITNFNNSTFFLVISIFISLFNYILFRRLSLFLCR